MDAEDEGYRLVCVHCERQQFKVSSDTPIKMVRPYKEIGFTLGSGKQRLILICNSCGRGILVETEFIDFNYIKPRIIQ